MTTRPPWWTPPDPIDEAHRRTEAKRRRRAELAEAREHGLRARHQTKLARLKGHSRMTAPNSYRLVLAKLFAEAEDKGLGTWSPTFRAAPGRENEAADYLGARAEFVAEQELGA